MSDLDERVAAARLQFHERWERVCSKLAHLKQLDSLGVDSLMMLELMFEFEDRFGINLSKDLKSPKTVGEMVTLMDRLRSEQN